MSRKRVTKKELAVALKENAGNMAAAGRRFHVSRQRIWEIVDADPKLRALVDDLSETFIDFAENKLFQAIKKGNIYATCFFLRTRGRHRGYSERLEVTPVVSREIEVEIGGSALTSNQGQGVPNRTATALLK